MPKPIRNHAEATLITTATLAAVMELGAAAIERIMGGEAVSNVVNGEVQTTRDVQDMLASRVQSHLLRS